MNDDMLEALYRDKEIIRNATLEEYKNSSLTRTPFIYVDYKRFERGFYTVKEHPDVYISKTLFYPKLHKASELFSDLIVLHDGVGNAAHALRPSGYCHMWDHDVNGPVKQITDNVPKLKAFKCAYVKPSFEHASWEDTGGWFTGVSNYQLHERENIVTGKNEWLVIGIDKTGISHHWLAVINEWDVKLST